ncbi:MAG: hypothetical protein QOD39_201 [Mycobacterium sp.]|nr:hypothetical protein [Mycobacterium sp.]
MSASTEPRQSLANVVLDNWRTFWLRPQPAYTLGAVRIAFGAIVVLWTVSLVGDLGEFFSSYGVLPSQKDGAYEWGAFEIWTGDRALMIGWVVLLLAAIALTVGWHSRAAALIVFVLIMSFEFRNPFIFNSGDALLRLEAFFVALAPSGAALSLDQRRATGRFWSAQVRAPWSVRLMQVQVTLIYVATFLVRMSGHKWPDGTALSYAFRLEDMLIFPLPHWVSTNASLMNVATWGTLVTELLIGILVWNRWCRPYALIIGVVLHSIILVTVAVGFFTPAMFVLYLAFVDPDTVRRLPKTLKTFAQQRLHAPRRDSAQPQRPHVAERIMT